MNYVYNIYYDTYVHYIAGIMFQEQVPKYLFDNRQ